MCLNILHSKLVATTKFYLLLLCCFCCRKLKKVSNLFLISLAIADLVVSCLVMPFAVGNDILKYWPFAEEFCNIWISFDILSATASILNLCAISLDRYIHMRNPFRYEEWMTNRKCLGFIGLIWLASILISFLPINLGLHKMGLGERANITATPQPPTSAENPYQCYLKLNPSYALISSSISFFIPCIIMLAIYAKIYQLARHHAKSIKKTQAFDHSNGGKNKKGENKALFTLGMIMGLFLFSWFPFFISNVVKSFCDECVPNTLFIALTWVGYVNSTMNPIIYSKFNADFRNAFKKILCCEKCRTADPYNFSTSTRSNTNGNSTNVQLRKINSNGVSHNRNGTSHISSNGHANHSQSECKDLIESESFIVKEDVNENMLPDEELDTRS